MKWFSHVLVTFGGVTLSHIELFISKFIPSAGWLSTL